ncbi:MAG: DUF2997 domain-containing protein [Planctomycetes bacterium]|nr:DUF2997 domain-containing protein [Planctomycetota bacterium]
MLRQIVVTIAPDGAVEVKVEGHAGPGCRDLTRALEADLGQTEHDRWTAEYHQPERQDDRQQAGR